LNKEETIKYLNNARGSIQYLYNTLRTNSIREGLAKEIEAINEAIKIIEDKK
jgi:hypothetical protein